MPRRESCRNVKRKDGDRVKESRICKETGGGTWPQIRKIHGEWQGGATQDSLDGRGLLITTAVNITSELSSTVLVTKHLHTFERVGHLCHFTVSRL